MNQNRIACALALVAVASASACKRKDANPNLQATRDNVAIPDEKAVEEKSREAPPVEAAFEFKGPGERLVKSIGGFTITSAPRYFGPSNLYRLINGGAEAYVSRGLKEMVTADYTSKDKPKVTITVEIYDLASAKNASDRFAKFLEGREDPVSAGKGLPERMTRRGLLGTTNVAFWKDKYLVNVTLLDESDTATKETMTALGAELLSTFAGSIDDAI